MTEYTFKKLPGRDVRRVLKDGKQSDLYVHTDNQVPGFRFTLWYEGATLGRFASMVDVKRALVLRQL